MIARGGRFEFVWSDSSASLAAIVAALVDRYNASGYGGRYAVRQDDSGGLHVVPVGSRSAAGAFVVRPPLLDAPVKMPGGHVSGDDLLLAVTQQVSHSEFMRRSPHHELGIGVAPTNLMRQTVVNVPAGTHAARELLVRLRAATGLPISWTLMCQPSYPVCMLNVHIVER